MKKEASIGWLRECRGEVIGGVGIGRIDSVAGVCELQKMYCLPEARGYRRGPCPDENSVGLCQEALLSVLSGNVGKYGCCTEVL